MSAAPVGNPEGLAALLGAWRPWRRAIVMGAAGILVLGWVASGYQTISQNELGIVTRFGAVSARVGPGFHYLLPWPVDRLFRVQATDIKRVDVGFTALGIKSSEPRRSDMLTGDQNILKVEMSVQYRVRADELERYIFGGEQPHWMVERAVESAMAHALARRAVDAILTSAKHELETDTLSVAQALLNRSGAGVELLAGSLQTVSPPVPVLDAFTDVASAKKDGERLGDEARAYESRVVSQARGRAQQRISEARASLVQRVSAARADAARFSTLLAEYRAHRAVTRTRLFISTVEQVLAASRAIVVDEGSADGRIHVVEERTP